MEEAGKELVPLLGGNLVDKVWGSGKPPQPKEPLRIHRLEHAGISAGEKIGQLRSAMTSEGIHLLG